MGVRSFLGLGSEPVLARSHSDPPDVSPVAEALYALIRSRLGTLTLEQARSMPPIVRAKMLIAGIGASLSPLAYRDGQVMSEQPSNVLRPDPFGTRYEFVWQTIDSLIDHGCAPWFLTGQDSAGYPTHMTVIPHDELQHEWAPRLEGLVRQYRWRGKLLKPEELRMVTVGRSAGMLCGRGPLKSILRYLEPVHMAEEWALAWFAAGGVPETFIMAKDGDLTAEEADAIRERYVERRTTHAGEPAVLPNTMGVTFPQIDPERAQLHESRAYGATIAARALGIPAALLHVETSGASITYSNAMAAVDELVKATIGPSYLTPIEQAWSELRPRPQVIRFDYKDMERADMQTRANIYKTLIDAGVMTPEEPRAYEGWGPLGQSEGSQSFQEAPPAREEAPVAVA